jgi:uncharacterized membrane protein (DUF4010 family)
MTEVLDLQLVRDFAIALLIGALIGLEREKRKTLEGDASIGGLRTFILFAEAGALSGWLSAHYAAPWIFGLACVGVCALITAGYVVSVRHSATSLGLTTEIAAVATFLLGGVCLAGEPALAVALGIITSATLAWKRTLHLLVAKLGEEDLYAGLKLLIASFIVLPLLPREAVDPWGALRPYELWLLVVLIAGLSLVGYVAMRWLGAGRGTAITGLLGGLVSSTAVTLTFARRSRDEGTSPRGASILVTGLLLAWTVMFVRVVAITAFVHRPLVAALVVPFTAMAVVSVAAAGVAYWFAGGQGGHEGVEVPLRNPFSLRSAISFALFFAGVLLVVEIARTQASAQSLYAVAALAGTTDVDAITLSMVTFARDGGDAATAVTAITLAALSNTLVKTGLALTLGSAAFRWRVGAVAMLVVAAAGLAVLAG